LSGEAHLVSLYHFKVVRPISISKVTGEQFVVSLAVYLGSVDSKALLILLIYAQVPTTYVFNPDQGG
jgi:hypothetical protein